MKEAYDFDPKDPMFGLSRDDMRGPKMSPPRHAAPAGRRGALTMAQVLPGLGRRAMAAAHGGGTLNCGWAGVGEIVTLDPAQINQVLQFQIASNVLQRPDAHRRRTGRPGRSGRKLGSVRRRHRVHLQAASRA